MESVILQNISVSELRDLISEVVAQQVKQLKQPKQIPELLTRTEVSKILGISLPTLNDWTKRGLIPALRISSRIRYTKDSIYQALKKVETLKYRRG